MSFIKFDEDKNAIINPSVFAEKNNTKIKNCPKTMITCFSKKLIDYAVEKYNAKEITKIGGANGKRPVYLIETYGKSIGLFMSSVGAPCCVGDYEDLFEIGVENIVVFGTCGVLENSIKENSIIIPTSAVREEGTSFHYVEPSEEIDVNINTFEKMKEFFSKFNYTSGKVWTTDAIYRETLGKFQYMKEKGCICVDMECSAVSAVSKFRNKRVAQFFYAADNLDNENYDLRTLGCDITLDEKYKIVDIAINLGIYLFE
ncbi:MAG: nucleoside phosphorylase [Parvimonas sp.]|uniref:nucleoside phosphorylase n=1 Tax=Parvimonas sp. TaxID=1944660 RepID=UPI0025F0D17C|nr:nucleoside phosphorylase [Parvimonas sp.]MCI5996908.1 nucleoside phosphorylase [Parvimonas sp.]MDY3051457.1 nucleoside phosphorylase [Parvimonas sp.]